MNRRYFAHLNLLRTGSTLVAVSFLLNCTLQNDQPFEPDEALHPTFSPDGAWIAFDARVDGNSDIYLVRPSGTDVRRLTSDPSVEVGPQWNADGTMLYYFRVTDGAAQVRRLQIASGRSFPTDVPAHPHVLPRWSPDGTRVILVDKFEKKQIVFLGGRHERAAPYLTMAEGYARALWAPDGQSFAASIDRDGVRDLYVHDLRTQTTRAVVRSLGRDLPMGFSPIGRGELSCMRCDRTGERSDHYSAPLGSRVVSDNAV